MTQIEQVWLPVVGEYVGVEPGEDVGLGAFLSRYSDMAGPMLAGFARARELGLTITGFESMCAIPLCLKPDGLGDYVGLSQFDAPETDGGDEFHKPSACDGCAQRDRCWGVRRGYVELYGTDELNPFAAS